MSKENAKYWAKGAADEMGDLIKLTRVDHLGLTLSEFARQINAKEGTVESCESGTSAHGLSVLKKTCDKFNLKLEISVSTK